MTSKQVQTLSKLLARESKADADKVQRALTDLHKLEQAHRKSVSETAKAGKAVEKAGKARLKTARTLNRAEEKLQAAGHAREKAEKLAVEKVQREEVVEQDLRQRHSQISQAFEEVATNEHSRAHQRSELPGTSGTHA